MSRPFLVTGAMGCIGAWVVERLLERGDRPVVFDAGDDPRRIRDLVGEQGLSRVEFVRGDVAEPAALRAALEACGARHVIHLAGLQVPFCRADPLLGARVNVLGTVNVLQAAADMELERVVYASSAAVYALEDETVAGRAPDETTTPHPGSHYGVYKLANEGGAHVFHAERGLDSVGLRPLTVYGVGRDQGMTSGPTVAIKAVATGRTYTIGFSGATDFLYAKDCAECFLAAADRAPAGAHVFNLAGDSIEVSAFLSMLAELEPRAAELVRIEGGPLPVPGAIAGAEFDAAVPDVPRTPLGTGIAETLARFRALAEAGRLDTRDLDG